MKGSKKLTYYEVALSLIRKEDGNAKFNFNLSKINNNRRKTLPKGTGYETIDCQIYTRYFHTEKEAHEYINLIKEETVKFLGVS